MPHTIQNKVHLTEEQKAVLREFRDSFAERPTFNDYERFQKKMKRVDPKQRPKRKDIPNTRLGFNNDEVKLAPEFDARTDLPPGWAVYWMMDSGPNYKILSAGQMLLTLMWNSWREQPPQVILDLL